MKSYVHVCFGLLALQVGVVAASAVINLSSSTFDNFINQHAVVMTMFYAPWCAVCKDLAPIYENTALKLNPSQDIKFARVDCVADGALCTRFETPIFPTIRVFRGPDMQDLYNGRRETFDMISYAEKRYHPAVARLTNSESIEVFRRSNEVAVVAFARPDDSDFKEIFARVAEENLDYYSFGATENVEAAVAEGITQPTIVLYKHYDDQKVIYGGLLDAEIITDFVDNVSIPLVGECDDKWAGRYIYKNAPPFVGIFAKNAEDRKQLVELIHPIAEKHKGLRFATVDTVKSPSLASIFKVTGSTMAILYQKQTFPLAEGITITQDEIGEWVEDFLAGKLTAQDAADPNANSRSVINSWRQGASRKDEL